MKSNCSPQQTLTMNPENKETFPTDIATQELMECLRDNQIDRDLQRALSASDWTAFERDPPMQPGNDSDNSSESASTWPCMVCKQPLSPEQQLVCTGCHHYFHKRCLTKWLSGKRAINNNCPACMQYILEDYFKWTRDTPEIYFQIYTNRNSGKSSQRTEPLRNFTRASTNMSERSRTSTCVPRKLNFKDDEVQDEPP